MANNTCKTCLPIVLFLASLAGGADAINGGAPGSSHSPTSQAAETDPGEAEDFSLLDDAAAEDLALLELEVPTVITASRREQKISTAPYPVSVITREDLRRSGVRSVADALRLVPGVDVAELGYGNFAVSPRGSHGLTSNRTLVLVDGREIYDAVFGGTLWGSWPWHLEDIERIEVVRGPGSVAWGANAANGVINIITRDPADQQGLTLHASGGSRGSHTETAVYGFTHEKLRMRVTGGYEGSDGFKSGGSFLRNLDDDYQSPQMDLSGVYEAGPDDTVSFSAGSSVVHGGFPPGLTHGFHRVKPGSQASFALGKWEHTIEPDNLLTLTGYVHDFHLKASKVIDYRYQQLALQLNHSLKPADNHHLTWGLDTRLDLVDATNASPRMLSKSFVSTPIIGLYAQDDWEFAPKWTFSLGGRIDYDSYGGFVPSARASLSYEITETSFVYGSVSRAFKLLPAASRFLAADLASGLLHLNSDRNLKSTDLMAYELGYRRLLFEKLDTRINAFWHETNNEIFFSPVALGPPGLLRTTLSNGPSSSLYGMEFEAKWNLTERLTLLGNYTFQRMDWRGPDFVWSQDCIAPPRNKFMLGARYSPTDDLHLSAHAYYVDSTRSPNPDFALIPRSVDSYLRLDLRAEHEFWQDRGFVAVGVRNLLDPHHLEGASAFVADAEVPRMIYAEVGIRLGQ